MANVYVTDTYLSDIADAIRAKNGLSTLYRPIEMGYAIDAIKLESNFTADTIAIKNFGSSISGNASFIGSYAFPYCSSLTTANFPNCISISDYAFAYCSALTAVSFPSCSSIGTSAFLYCSSLTAASFPNCIFISSYAFQYCYKLTTVSFPNCTSIGGSAFAYCSALTAVSFPNCSSISIYAFQYCYNLISLYLDNVSQVPTLGTSVFSSTPIGGYSTSAGRYGSVFVPSSLYNSFITATNWTTISARIVSV